MTVKRSPDFLAMWAVQILASFGMIGVMITRRDNIAVDERASPARPSRSPFRLFLGWLFLATGGVLVVVCGSCTVLIGAPALIGSAQAGDWTVMEFVAIYGGIPILLGVFLFCLGWKISPPP